ncbi:MAG: hypothetical protein ACRC0V_11580 [Fusobacteriaceae bacterium]
MSSEIFELPKFIPRNFQMEIFKHFENKNARMLVAVARRGGKDISGLEVAHERCLLHAGSNVGYLALSIKQLKKILFSNDHLTGKPMFETVVHKETIKINKNGKYFKEQLSYIEYKNGSMLFLLGSDSSQEVGTSLNLLVVSEAGLFGFDTWKHLIPSVKGASGGILTISTTRNGSDFNELIRYNGDMSKIDNNSSNKDDEKEQDTKENTSKYKVIVVPADKLLDSDGKRVYSDSDLEQLKFELDDATFKEEFMCEIDAITELSVLGKVLTNSFRFNIDESIKSKPNIGRTMHAVFDLGNTDECCMFLAYEDQQIDTPIFFDFMIKAQTPLKEFVDYALKVSKTFGMTEEDINFILPHDGKQTYQGMTGSLNRKKELMKYMPKSKIAIALKVNVYDSLRATRLVIKNHHIGFSTDEKGKDIVKILSSINHKVNPKTGKPIYEVSKRSGIHEDHPLDSLKNFVVYKFKTMFLSDDIFIAPKNHNDYYPGNPKYNHMDYLDKMKEDKNFGIKNKYSNQIPVFKK